jgi:tetratricopeptide (TPR) repeat protein
MLPLLAVVLEIAKPGFYVREVQEWITPLGKPWILIAWIVTLGILSVVTYVSSFWAQRRRRPSVGLLFLALPWSALPGTWWWRVNFGRVENAQEILLMAIFVLGPPMIIFGLEAMVTKALMARGMRLHRLSEHMSAVRLLRLVQLLRPADTAITRAIGLSLYHAREWEQAQTWLLEARRGHPKDMELAAALADLAQRREDWEGAIVYLRERIDRSPRDQEAWEVIAKCHLALNQLDKAIYALEQLERSDIPHLIRLLDLSLALKQFDHVLNLAMRIRESEPPPHRSFVRQIDRLLEARPGMSSALEAMLAHSEEMGKPEEIHSWRLRILEIRPDDESLRRLIMQHCRDTGQLVALGEHLRHLVQRDEPKHVDLVELIDLVTQRREWDELRGWLQRAKEYHPDAWEFLLADAQLALVSREFDRAFQLCHMARARVRDPQDLKRIDALLERLKRARSENELDELRRAIAEDSDPIPLRWELIERLTTVRSFDQVATELDEIIRQDAGQRERVVAALDEMLKEHPNNFSLLNYLRDLLMRERAFDAVFETSERMVQHSLDPDKVLREACDRILQVDPTHRRSLEWMACHAHSVGDWPVAVAMFDRWFEVDAAARENLENLQLLFDALVGRSDLERGVKVARALLEAHHQEANNLKALATLYQQHGRLEEAKQCFLRARGVDSQDREVHQSIRALDEEIRLDRIHEIQVVLEREPDNTDLHHELGDLLYSFQRYTDAIPHLQRASADSTIANLCRAKIAHALANRRLLDMAHETLAEVALESGDPKQLEALKAIFFNVGEIFREEGQRERALETFKRLFRIDAAYRDVVKRIEKLSH